MAKRSAVRRIRAEYEAQTGRDGVPLEVIEGGWDPLHEEQRYTRRKKRQHAANDHHLQQRQQPREQVREQAYVKNVQPKSEGQARMIQAIDASHCTLALGPAG